MMLVQNCSKSTGPGDKCKGTKTVTRDTYRKHLQMKNQNFGGEVQIGENKAAA